MRGTNTQSASALLKEDLLIGTGFSAGVEPKRYRVLGGLTVKLETPEKLEGPLLAENFELLDSGSYRRCCVFVGGV